MMMPRSARGWHGLFCVTAWVLILGAFAGPTEAQPVARAEPPDWKKHNASAVFFEDAFRDAFGGKQPFIPLEPQSSGRGSVEGATPIGETASRRHTGPSDWSQLDAAVLVDKIKSIANGAAKATRSARTFAAADTSGLQSDLRFAALLLRGLHEWPEEVRFRRQSASVSRHLAATAGKVKDTTMPSYQAAKRAAVELQDLVRGQSKELGDPPAWSEVIARDELMDRLDSTLEASVSKGIVDEPTFVSLQDEMQSEAQVMVAILIALRQTGAPDAELPSYVEYCRTAESKARRLVDAIASRDSAQSQKMLQATRDACEACHEEFQ